MPDITLWGRLNSSNVQKATWTLAELGFAFEQISVGGPYKGLDDPRYRAMNPNGLVPTLRDGDLLLWESHAIVRYLCARYASGLLWPTDPVERAIVDQWTDWTATTFGPAWTPVFWKVVRTPVEQQDPQAIKTAVEDANRQFEIMEARLEQSPYLGGDSFSYADIVAGVAMYRWVRMPIERRDLPAVERWHTRLLERPAFQEAVCVPYDDLMGKLSF